MKRSIQIRRLELSEEGVVVTLAPLRHLLLLKDVLVLLRVLVLRLVVEAPL